ncbi:MAG: VCBS repeat-containing protein [Bacteroidetes bacterium]|nr:VCBS repeat-containing protein [Bacteroidota bacterium]
MKRLSSFVFIVSVIVFPSYSQISSTFDTDADGWTFLNTSTSVPLAYSSTGGNPGGFVSATYSSNTGVTIQNWIAPSKFLGNQLARALGMTLKFDLQQSQAGATGGFDVRIENGSSFIYFVLPAKPAVAPAWSSYTLTLDETTAWKYSAGNVTATRDQIISILRNVTSIEIRGTYATNAAYTSGLDNVFLDQRILTPAPVATSLSATSGKPGDVIIITGSGFNTTPSANRVSFGTLASTSAVVQSATINQLQVVVPVGASYGPITITNTVTGLSSKAATPFNPVFDGGGRIVPASFRDKFTISTIAREGFFVGDMDGDGWEDFAVANNNADDVIDIYRNLGLGGNLSAASFDTKVSVAIPQLGGSGTNGAGLWFADLDGDGMLDAVSSNATSAISAAFVTLRNISTPGNLAFEAPEYWAGGSDETPINLIADLDGDGRPELMGGESAICGCVRTDFWFNQNISTPGNIEFGSASGLYNNSVINGFGGAQIGDLNGDGKGDLLVGHQVGNRFTVLQNTSVLGVPSFLNSFTFDTDRTMRVVDVNLDGKNDLVWRKSGSLYFRINTDTDGILTVDDFATEFILANEIGVDGGISITDFNGDGKPDIAVTDSDAVGVFENIFDGGTFSAASFIPAFQVPGAGAGSNTSSPVVSDLNHDGKPDFLIAGSASVTIVQNNNVVAPHISLNTVSPLSAPVGSTVTITGNNFSTVLTDNEVWFGDVRASVLTASTTQLTVTVPAGAAYAPVSVRRGEFSSSYHLPFSTSFSAGVTFDNTHFAPPVSYTLTGADYDIEVGDLELDGKPDIIAEGSGLISRIFQNSHTTGAISASSLTVVGTTATSSANPKLADVDGDGKLDIVSPNGRTYPNQSTTGTISFGTNITTASGDNITFGDLNLDGKTDLVSAAPSSGSAQLQLQENRSNVGVFVNNGTYGTFTNNIIYNKASRGGDVAIADFDNDGFNDVVSLNPFTDNMSVFRNAQKFRVSTTLFNPRVDIAVGDNPLRAYPADFDRDGKIDLLITHWTGTSTTLLIVFQNTSTVGNISFNRIDLTNPSTVTIATVADLDGDGKPEIIATSESGNRFSIYKNLHTSGALTSASFDAPFNTTVTAPRGITTGDLNLDGKPEIIITRAAGLLVVYENLIPSIPPPTISSFTPTSGAVGITVTITGTNFDTTPANNIVKFNGTDAHVTTSTTTSLTVIVPPSSTTGPISIDVLGNVANSASNFIVVPFACPPSTPTGGTLDTSFDPAVQIPTDFNAVRLQSNGQILAVTNSTTIGGVNYSGMLRFNTNGTLDTSFGNPAIFSGPSLIAIQPDDKIISVQLIGNLLSIKRFNSDGTPDTSFSGPSFDNSGFYDTIFEALCHQTDGKILFSTYNTFNYFREITRLNNDGSTDASFTSPPSITEAMPVIKQQTDGKILIGGPYGVIRLTSTGTIDPAFQPGSTDADITDLELQADGKIVVVGPFNKLNSVPASKIARLNTDGSFDITFQSGNGITGYTSIPYDLEMLPDRKIVVTGSFSTYNDQSRNYVAVINENGSLDCLFDSGSGPTNDVYHAAGQSDGMIVIAGAFDSYGGTTRNGLARVNNILKKITITTQPSDFSGCVGQTATFTSLATGTTNITYQWQISPDGVAPFTDIANGGGYSNVTTTTLSINTTGNFGAGRYRCRINGDFAAEVISNDEGLFINPIPAAPGTTGATTCKNGTVTLQASGANDGEYLWYTLPTGGTAITDEFNSTFLTPSLTATTTYYVSISKSGCEGPRTPVLATVTSTVCGPVFTPQKLVTQVEGKITINLVPLITTSGTLDVNSIRVTAPLNSGASAVVVAGVLTIDYKGKPFSGNEVITIEACNTNGECNQQPFTIEVAGDIVVYNAVSPNGDDKNPFLFLQYIDVIPETKTNRVTIFNRWGDEVFSVSDYDNKTKVFIGLTNDGSKLPAGTYFYKIELPLAGKSLTGFFDLKY